MLYCSKAVVQEAVICMKHLKCFPPTKKSQNIWSQATRFE